MEKKLKVIENARKANLRITFVPTIVKGFNDHEIGDLIRLAIENIDVISGISFQPVAFCGRITKEERERMRFTVGDFAKCVEEQTGIVKSYNEWMPLACINVFSKLQEALNGTPTTGFSCNPHCSMGTYFFIDENKKATSMFEFLDFKNMVLKVDELSRSAQKTSFKSIHKVKTWFALKKFFNKEKAPKGMTFKKLLECLEGYRDKKYRFAKTVDSPGYPVLFIAAMHFQDSYNFDVERIKRCVIHYSAPDNKMYPFCTYNAGPNFRERIEQKFSIPLTDYKANLTVV